MFVSLNVKERKREKCGCLYMNRFHFGSFLLSNIEQTHRKRCTNTNAHPYKRTPQTVAFKELLLNRNIPKCTNFLKFKSLNTLTFIILCYIVRVDFFLPFFFRRISLRLRFSSEIQSISLFDVLCASKQASKLDHPFVPTVHFSLLTINSISL